MDAPEAADKHLGSRNGDPRIKKVDSGQRPNEDPNDQGADRQEVERDPAGSVLHVEPEPHRGGLIPVRRRI